MDLGRAIATSFATGNGRKPKDGEVDETAQVGWGHALVGVVLLLAVQLALILWPTGAPLDAQILRDLGITALAALMVPFVLFWLTAVATGTTARLPASFLYLGIVLAVLQVASAVLASFGTGQSGFLIGLLFAIAFLAARGFFLVHWGIALIIGALVVAGFIAANFLLLMLPTGRLLR